MTDLRHITIGKNIMIDVAEIQMSFIRSAGPGGQNVNKVATAVQLRFDARRSRAIDDRMFTRLSTLAGQRMTKEGVIVLTANRFRTQSANREDAVARLKRLLEEAEHKPAFRVSTKPSRSAKERRLKSKRRTGDTKKMRGRVSSTD